MVIGIPIYAYSKKENCSSGIPAVFRATFAMMFGGVPISVQVPPRPAANARGMRIRDGERFASLQTPMMTGMRQAVVPVFERKADMTAAMIMTPIISFVSLVPKTLTIRAPMSWARPV